MSNSISFLGRIGSEPELKQVGQSQLLKVNVANNVGFGDRQVTNWFGCNIWGKRAESLQAHLSKGKQIFVTGELTLRKYTNKDGVEAMSPEVNVNDVEFVSAPQDDRGQQPKAQTTPTDDDDMPF